ncbi:MAG: hypothetical protein OES32_14525 [Acidobacteriota bacterium]|nr:hypothetical protein [Acidobacteriota bacterium]MDH3524796.1 hypothetical protein [Acidobacteriota bacterium]
MLGRSFAVVAAGGLLAAATWAQAAPQEESFPTEGVGGGLITDGVNEWLITGPSAEEGVFTDFYLPAGGTDHQFATWWWYRVEGDAAETRMPPPDTESYVGDTARLTWADVDGRGLFSAEALAVIVSFPPGSVLYHTLGVGNLSGGNLDLHVFAYLDMDMDGDAAGDSAIEAGPFSLEITERSRAVYQGATGPDAYRVDAWPAVRDALNDAVVDDFANTGLPFGPGDFSGAFQWNRVLPVGGYRAFHTGTCVNTDEPPCDIGDLVFDDGFETGDTSNWDAVVP